MAYQPYDRTPKGIVFFGENAADQVYESTSGFVYTSGTSTLDVPNVDVSGNLDVGGNVDVTGNGTFDGDLTVYGNLNVSGVVNQIDLQELLVEDNSITLNSNYSSTSEPSADAFISVNRGPSHSEVDIRWDEGLNYWTFTNDGSTYNPLMGSWTVSDESNTQKTIQNNDVVRHSGVGLDVTVTGSSSPYLLTFSVNVDDSTLEVHTDDNLRVRDLGIDTAQLASGAVTEAKRERTVGTYNSTSSITHDIALGSGVINLTLPPAASGKMVFVKRTDSATGALTVEASGSQKIDGAGNKALYYQYESINVVSDGTNWFIV